MPSSPDGLNATPRAFAFKLQNRMSYDIRLPGCPRVPGQLASHVIRAQQDNYKLLINLIVEILQISTLIVSPFDAGDMATCSLKTCTPAQRTVSVRCTAQARLVPAFG